VDQIAYLSGMVHRRRMGAQIGRRLEELVDSPLAADPHGDVGATIRQIKRDYEKRLKLPTALVEELTRTSGLGQQSWTEARKNGSAETWRQSLRSAVLPASGRGFGRVRRAVRQGRIRPVVGMVANKNPPAGPTLFGHGVGGAGDRQPAAPSAVDGVPAREARTALRARVEEA
jgi:hypothetical protein